MQATDDPRAAYSRPSQTIEIMRKISASRSIRETITRYADTTLFDALFSGGWLDERQHRAAERLYGIWMGAGLAPRVTQDYRTVAEMLDDEGGATEGGEMDMHNEWGRLQRLLSPIDGEACRCLMWYDNRLRPMVYARALGSLADAMGIPA